MGRSLLAVIAGFVATILVSLACDGVRVPDKVETAFSVFYMLVSAAIGGYLAALIARRAEVMHALAVGTLVALATLLIIVSVPATRRTAGELASAMLLIPAALLGGWLEGRRKTVPLGR